MARIVLEEQVEIDVLPTDSIILVKVESVEEREVNSERGNWTKLEFKFKVLDVIVAGDGTSPDRYKTIAGSPIWGSVPMRFTTSKENRLRLWVEALLGMELTPGFDLDTDLLVGRKCRAITSSYKKRNGFDAHQVSALLPLASTASTASTPSVDDDPGF